MDTNKVFRFIFGLYLAAHFMTLFPYADELIGDAMPYTTVHMLSAMVPNILDYVNVKFFMLTLMVSSAIFTFTLNAKYVRFTSLYILMGWASILIKNPLTSNPGIPYVGWLLLVHVFYPDKKPKRVMWTAWFLMALGYTMSGIHKLSCPSWIDGTALLHVMNSPLARDNFIRDFMMLLPDFILKAMTWVALFLEISALPLGLFRHTRYMYHWAFIFMHLGICLMVNFLDLTLGVMMIHLFLFERDMFENPFRSLFVRKKPSRKLANGSLVQ
jgi:hypothetical protein